MSSNKEKMTEFIANKVGEIPTLPTIIAELNRLISYPMSSRKQIVDIIERDQALTIKVLKLINSGFYAIPGGVQSLDRAIMLLGLESVYHVVLATSIVSAVTVDTKLLDIKKFWQHSFGVAVAAQRIGSVIGFIDSNSLFTAGLVHDLGKIAMLKIDPDLVFSVANEARKSGISFSDAENKLEAPKHTHIGFLLAERWKLPPIMQNAIKFHHNLVGPRGFLPINESTAVDIVALANIIVHQLNFGDSGYDQIPQTPTELINRLGLEEKNLPEILARIKDELESASGFLKLLGA